MTYRADIDGLRAVAILLVVVFHFELLPFAKPGFIGVDVFFVISGFLITSIIHADLAAGRFSLVTFYLKRLRRLYPALLATMGLYLVAGYFLFLPDLFQQLAEQILLSLAYVVNFYFWQTVNYFGFAAKEVPLLHIWSLAVEEQFYLFFPLAMLVVFRLARRALIPLILLAGVVSYLLGAHFAALKPELAFYMLPTRAWEMLIGAVLALAFSPTFRLPAIGAGLLGLAGFAAILAALVLHTPAVRVPGWFTLLPTLGAAALILAGTSSSAPTTRFLSLAPMVWVGKISYPLYLVHWPILILLKYSAESFGTSHKIAGTVASFALAWAIFAFVETPIRKGVPIRPAWPVLWRMGGGSLAIAVVAAVCVILAGLPGRFTPTVNEALALRGDRPDVYQRCSHGDGTGVGPKCAIGVKGPPPRVFAFGDSHALHYAPALDLWLTKEGQSGELLFSHSCMPVLRAGGRRCENYAGEVLDYLESAETIETVFLLSIWRQPFEVGGMHVDGIWRSGPDALAGFEAGLIETVERLIRAGKKVVVVEPLFSSSRNVPLTLAKNLAFGRDWAIDRSLADHETDFAAVFRAFDAAATAGALRMTLLADLCEDGICSAVRSERPLFSDNNHLAASAAPFIAGIFRREARQLGVLGPPGG